MTQTNENINDVLGLEESQSENDYTTQSNLQIFAIPIKLPMVFFTELEKIISQFVRKYKKLYTKFCMEIPKKKKQT